MIISRWTVGRYRSLCCELPFKGAAPHRFQRGAALSILGHVLTVSLHKELDLPTVQN